MSANVDGNWSVKFARENELYAEIAQVTGLSERTVRNHLENSHGAVLLRNLFDDSWPDRTDEVGAWSVAFAREQEAAREISDITGVGSRKVAERLELAVGRMLVRNVFAEEWPGDFEDEDDDAQLEMLGELTVAVVRESNLHAAIAERLGMSTGTVRRRVDGSHGRTTMKKLFEAEWPLTAAEVEADLRSMTVGYALEHADVIRGISSWFGITQKEVRERLQAVRGNMLAWNVFRNDREDAPPSPPTSRRDDVTAPPPAASALREAGRRERTVRPEEQPAAEVAPRSKMFRRFDLVAARKLRSRRDPAAHQVECLQKLHAWYRTAPKGNRGGILVLPTGGGKTFTSVRFLCQEPLSDGYKVLWLAHTHHLLEQAVDSFGPDQEAQGGSSSMEVAQIAEPRAQLDVRVVSGTEGHHRPADIKPTDDVLIMTLQTASNAFVNRQPHFLSFLESAGEKLVVVFDEAHHAPAPSYARLVESLRAAHPEMYLLGLTATPTYSDERRQGWLKKLFPQEVIASITRSRLIAAKVLSKPIFTDANTELTFELDESEYQRWLNTAGDLPESIVTDLAKNERRNDFIVGTYVREREKYGKTLIFADRWYQCDYIAEALKKNGVRADVIYSHVDAGVRDADERRRRTRDENARVLDRFRGGELDVLVNVRMLTEGTDVPLVKSVFITRQTTSGILLTQMIGRALRGPAFGGTEEAHIVSFIDNWKQVINFADYQALPVGRADDGTPEYSKRPPLQLISIELVRRLSRAMHSGGGTASEPFLTLLPVGWYATEFPVAAGGDDLAWSRNLVMVFASEQQRYEAFVKHLCAESLEAFVGDSITLEDRRATVDDWATRFFPQADEHPGSDLGHNLFLLARHVAQTPGVPPPFFPFEERSAHDFDAIARSMIERDLGPRAQDEALMAEYLRVDRFWRSLYLNYQIFYSQYQAVQRRALDATKHGYSNEEYKAVVSTPEVLPAREPSPEVKRSVFRRDGNQCCCCGSKRRLEVDHIVPQYYGGAHDMDQLQTLCRVCNANKAINELNFRTSRTPLQIAPRWTRLDVPADAGLDETETWDAYVRRSVNFFYQCGAVDTLEIERPGGGHSPIWSISLRPGNDPKWFEANITDWLQYVNEVRSTADLGEVREVRVTAVT